MAETLLDALVKLRFEGENAVGQAADTVRRIEQTLKRVDSLPNVNFNMGEGLGQALEGVQDIAAAYRQLIPLAEQAERALREAGSGRGAGNTQRANNISKITDAMRQQVSVLEQLTSAERRQSEAISQTAAVNARRERQARNAGGAGGGGGTPPPTAPPPPPGGMSNFDRLWQAIAGTTPGASDPVMSAQARLAIAIDEQAKARKALNRLAPTDDKYEAAEKRAANSIRGVLDANRALQNALEARAKAEAKAQAAAERAWDKATVQTSEPFRELKYAKDNKFLDSLGIDSGAPANERRQQVIRATSTIALAENKAAIDSIASQKDLGRLTANRARLAERKLSAEEREQALVEKRLEAEQQREAASKDSRLARLQMSPEAYAADRGIDTGQPLSRQRLDLALQQNTLAREGIAEQARLVAAKKKDAATTELVAKLDEQMLRLVREEAQLRQQSAALAAKERKAARGSGGFLAGLFGQNEDDEGYGQGFAYSGGMTLRYYAMYAGFAALQQAMGEVVMMTAQYTLAISQLSIALGVSYQQASKAGAEYAAIGQQFGVGPIESIGAATKFTRTFRNPDGSIDPNAGLYGARLGSLVTTLEPEDRRQNTQQDLIAVAKANGVAASGLERLYDKFVVVAQRYGYESPGEIMSGVAAVSDIGKESGYKPEELAAAIASIMRGTGTTSDAAAGDLKRFLGAQNDPALVNLFSRFNIDQDGSLKQKLTQLAAALEHVDPEERSRTLTGIGGPRIASAVAALISGIPEADRVAADAQGANGTAAEQAQHKLESFGGALQKLGGELQGLFAAIADSGVGDVLITLAGAMESVLTVVRSMIDLWNMLPGPLKATATAILMLAAAQKAQEVLTGGGMVSSVASSVMGLVNPVRAPKVGPAIGAEIAEHIAAVGGPMAVGGRMGETAFNGRMAKAADMFIGVGESAAKMAVMLGPAAAALAAVALAAGLIEAKQKADQGDKQSAAGATDLQKAIETGDPEKIRDAVAAIEGGQAQSKEAAANAQGYARMIPIVGTYLAAGIGDGANPEMEAKIAAGLKRAQEIEAEQARLQANSPTSAWFGKNYNNVSGGVALIKTKGVDAGRSTEIIRDLLNNASPEAIRNALQPGDQQLGLADLTSYVMQRYGSSNNPLAQQKGYGQLHNALASARQQIAATGDAGQVESLRQSLEQVDRAWAASVVANTKAKVDMLKSRYTGAGTDAEIRALVTQALQDTIAAGDVNATVELLNQMDKGFIQQFSDALYAQRNMLQEIRASLNAAYELALNENADTGNIHNDIRGDMKVARDQAQLNRVDQNIKDVEARTGTFRDAQALANPTGAALRGDDQLAIARLHANAASGDGQASAKAAVDAAQIAVDRLVKDGKRDTAEYYDKLKALNDAKQSYAEYELNLALAQAGANRDLVGNPLAQARNDIMGLYDKINASKDPVEKANLQRELYQRQREYRELEFGRDEAKANAQVTVNDPMAEAKRRVEAARNRMNFTKDPTEYWNAYKELQDAKFAVASLELQEAQAKANASLLPNDPLAAANLAIEQAKQRMALNKNNTAEYYAGLQQLHQAQYERARLELELANNEALLKIDITDPVALAKQRVKQATDQLAFDRNRGAGRDVIAADEVALRQARSDEASTKWSQTFGDMRTNYDLNRISLSAYMKYLQSQHDYLSAIKVKTRIQVEQLAEVDQALKSLTESMNGQWNLGEIKVPTAYEMRRMVAGGAAAGTANVSYVTITMTGSSKAEMQAALEGAIGQPILQTVGTTSPKV